MEKMFGETDSKISYLLTSVEESRRGQARSEFKEALRKKRHKRMSIVMFLAGGLVLGGGFLKNPPADPEANLPVNFAVEVPVRLSDTEGVLTLQSLNWTESHGSDMSILYPSEAEDIREIEEGHTRINLVLVFDRTAASRVPINASFVIPEGAQLSWCTGPPGIENKAACILKQRTDRLLSDETITAVMVRGEIQPGSTNFTAQIDLSGIDGMNFVMTRSRAIARFPSVVASEVSGRDYAADIREVGSITLETGLLIDEAYRLDWNERPPVGNSSLVGWSERQDLFAPSPGLFLGVREQIVRSDSSALFWAGFLLGIGGAMVLAALQLFID